MVVSTQRTCEHVGHGDAVVAHEGQSAALAGSVGIGASLGLPWSWARARAEKIAHPISWGFIFFFLERTMNLSKGAAYIWSSPSNLPA